MSEKIKESISFLKLLLTFSITLDAGCIAWLFKNFVSASIFQKSLTSMSIIILTFVALILVQVIIEFLRDLKE